MNVLLGDVHLSELKRFDKPCTRVGRELTNNRSSVNDTSHSSIHLITLAYLYSVYIDIIFSLITFKDNPRQQFRHGSDPKSVARPNCK